MEYVIGFLLGVISTMIFFYIWGSKKMRRNKDVDEVMNIYSKLQKKSKNSFASQRQLLKQVMAGKTVLCTICRQPLFLQTPKHTGNTTNENSGIRCQKGCTDIQLDFV